MENVLMAKIRSGKNSWGENYERILRKTRENFVEKNVIFERKNEALVKNGKCFAKRNPLKIIILLDSLYELFPREIFPVRYSLSLYGLYMVVVFSISLYLDGEKVSIPFMLFINLF